MRAILEQVARPDGQTTVVDVGCGTGANLATLADGYRCVGIDTSSEAIDLAARRFPDVRFVCGLAPDDLGDAVHEAGIFLVMDVLEHVPDDFELLSSLLAAAKPGARFLITVPAHAGLWSPHDVAFGHYRRYDRERLLSVWSGLPVNVKLCSYYNSRLYPVVRGVRAMNRLLGRSSGASGTDFNLPAAPINDGLTRLFAGESRRLIDVIHGRRPSGYCTGVSLIALIERREGEIVPRKKPDWVAADVYNPRQSRELALVG